MVSVENFFLSAKFGPGAEYRVGRFWAILTYMKTLKFNISRTAGQIWLNEVSMESTGPQLLGGGDHAPLRSDQPLSDEKIV